MPSDKYAWLENVQDPNVVEWARKQDSISRRSLRAESDKLYRRISRYYDLTLVRSAQLTADGIVLFSTGSKSHKVELLAADGKRRTLVDSTKLGKFAVIQSVQARKEGRLVAVHYSLGGSDEGAVSIIDARTGKEVDRLEGVIGQIVWLDDRKFYYVRGYFKEKSPDGADPPTQRVILRKAGKEEMVFGEGLPTGYFIGMEVSSDGSKALLDVSFGWTKSRPYAGEVGKPDSWIPVYPDTGSMVTNVDYSNGRHYLLSFEKNMGQVLSTDGKAARRLVDESQWPIEGASLVGDKLVCHYLVDSSSELRTFDLTGRQELSLRFDVPGSIVSTSVLGEEAAFVFSSFTVPYRVYRLRRGRLDTIASQELPAKYSVSQGRAVSKDGTPVHYFTVARKGVAPKKVILWGYGGFRVSLTPFYAPAVFPFLDDGGTLAVANLRGGLELGEDWHRAGMRENKPRVFEDFVAVAEKLKSEGAKVVASGGSNGGLLVGASLNLRPDVFAGGPIGYPVLDMLSFHRLYIGRAWVPEYGDPDVPADAEFLVKYSPYHNVNPRSRYPPVFIYTGLKDDRVHPAHAFKYYSRMKDVHARVLMRVEMESGHTGTDPRTHIKEDADRLAFVYRTLGMDGR